jgi:hypothetical protein
MRRIRICLAAVGGTACAVLALASVSQAAASSIKGSYASTCTSSGAVCLTIAGREAPIGPFTGAITGFVPSGTGGCPPAADSCTTGTITTANGDKYYTFTILYVTGFDSSTGMLEFVQQINVVGGTGRFTDATGTSAASGEASPDFSTYHASYSGTFTP